MFFFDVLIARPFDKTFTYSYSSQLDVGSIVYVEFGRSKVAGVILAQREDEFLDTNFKIKPILQVLGFCLSNKDLRFLDKVSEYNVAYRGMILRQMIPQNAMDIKKLVLQAEGGAKKRGRKPKDLNKLEPDVYNFNLHKLNKEQLEVYSEIAEGMNHFKVHLIDGETGSGKTEVYLKLAYDIIANRKRQVLILLPEIFLTKQLLERFEHRIGCRPTEWHSKLTPKQRKENFHKITTGKSKFVIGARSALFLPYHDLGMIVVDEEHDRSYKQEELCIYNARDMAIMKARVFDINVLLTSATPSLESFHNANTGKYEHHKLTKRFGNAKLPLVKIIDLNTHKLEKNRLISGPLFLEIKRILNDSKQVLLFLNKRGYAPILHCSECNYREHCINCNSLLVYHKRKGKLLCHHCGFEKKFISNCSQCGSDNLRMIGLGIEKLEAEVLKLFPNYNSITLASDMVGSSSDIEESLSKIINEDVQIILGTQMISKGLHFPNLRMVAVMDAESNVMGYDPRALEHTYQMLHQVSGRAGREDDKGIVLLQTYEPENPVFKCMQNFDKDSFYEYEYQMRKITKTAPIYRMFSVTVIDKDESKCVGALQEFKSILPNEDEESLIFLGPAPTPMYYMKGLYRYRFIVKASKKLNLQKNLKDARDFICKKFNIRCVIDVDPQNFL